ncbi:MAG TPA: hypothetical protein VK190_04525 [Pseudoneobacillus sp.]|nr:hypothetical protein [Pseudoneobacillus sp.]
MGKRDIVKAHIDVRTLTQVAYYWDHIERSDSPEFRKVKQHFKDIGAKCFINNGKCEGSIEIHHSLIEFAASEGIDWEKVKKDFPNIDHVDDLDQMMPLCRKHHREQGFGIHNMEYGIWILQKYMKPEVLEEFEKAVKLKLND